MRYTPTHPGCHLVYSMRLLLCWLHMTHMPMHQTRPCECASCLEKMRLSEMKELRKSPGGLPEVSFQAVGSRSITNAQAGSEYWLTSRS